MEQSTQAMEKAKQKMEALTGHLHSLDQQLTQVSRSTQKAAQAVSKAVVGAGKVTQALATLLDFDEINRLREKTVSAGTGRSSGAKAGETGKVKTGPSLEYGFELKFTRPPKEAGADFMTQFRLGLQQADNGGQEAGQSLIQRLGQGVTAAFGSGGGWVTEHLWSPIQSAWTGLGDVAVTVGAVLSNTAGELWNGFQSAWQTGGARSVSVINTLASTAGALWQSFQLGWGTRSVSILDTLASTAGALWQGFQAGWGTRSVSILDTLASTAGALWQGFQTGWGTRSVSVVNTLANSAATLWSQFRSGWAGRVLSLSITYNSNVSGIKKAVYKALGLAGWPTISFAARGGVFRSATLTMLGEAGAEAVVPLENNTGWMDMMAEKLGERMGAGGSVTVPVYIGGEKLAEKVVEAVNAVTRRTGASPLYI